MSDIPQRGAIIICQICGKETVKQTTGHQKYCPDCSLKKDIERKRKWAENNGQKFEYDPEKQKEKYQQNRSRAVENGIAVSNGQRETITYIQDAGEDATTLVRIAVPFEYGFSKNAAWSFAKSGHVFLKENHKILRDLMVYRIKEACKNIKCYEDKIWIDIYVQKPDHKGDAVNVVDCVCDAVKVAIGVDDRWYSIKGLDWQIVKENPMIFVGISQNQSGDKRVCSLCGRILELEHFTKNKRDRLGRSRECKECSKTRDAEKRKRRKNQSTLSQKEAL